MKEKDKKEKFVYPYQNQIRINRSTSISNIITCKNPNQSTKKMQIQGFVKVKSPSGLNRDLINN